MSGFTIKRFVIFCFIILCVITLDQLLKEYVVTHLNPGEQMPIIDGILNLLHTQNHGIILGIDIHGFKYLRLVTLGFKILLLLLLFSYVFDAERHEKLIKTKIVAGAFLIGGGLSNCIDWMFNGFSYKGVLYYDAPFNFGYGNVIDMIYLPFTHFQIPSSWPILGGMRGCFPIFNIADIFIVLGCLMAIPFVFDLGSTGTQKGTRKNITWLKKRRRRSSPALQTKIKGKRSTAKRNKSK